MIFFFVFAQAFKAEEGGAITQVVTMVSVIGILGNGLFGAGMRAVQERENNILRRYKVTPISPAPPCLCSNTKLKSICEANRQADSRIAVVKNEAGIAKYF